MSFRNELDHELGIFLVAHEKSDVVGFAALWLVADEAHIINLATDPQCRRRGYAKRLVYELLHAAKERGAVCATLEVRESNSAARGLYESFGFEACGLRKNYYPDNNESAVVMWMHSLDSLDQEN